MTGECSVLLSSAGRRVALLNGFREALAALQCSGRVLAADASGLSSALHAADEGFRVPPCTSEEFIPSLVEICRAHDVRLLVPTIDTELPVLSAHREVFAAHGVSVAVSSPELVRIGADKIVTHRWLVDHQFPTVRQADVAEVLARPESWHFPLVVKPRFGSGSIGVSRVNSVAELKAATGGLEAVVQVPAEGVEHTVDVLVDRQGHCRAAVPRRRLEVRAGEVSKAVTVRIPALEVIVSRLAESLPGAYGALNVQAFVGEDISVIELNPRFGGGFPLSWQAGARFPELLVAEAAGIRQGVDVAQWRQGVVMLRYDDAVFVDTKTAGLDL